MMIDPLTLDLESKRHYLNLLRRKRHFQIMRNEGGFQAYCEEALHPLGFVPQIHHRLMISKLEAVDRGDIKRLALFLPPGSAKSTYATHLFPGWFLARKANRRVALICNTSTFAQDNSKDCQGYIDSMQTMTGMGLNPFARPADRWRTTNGGFCVTAGMAGTITGRRADLAIIDDPVKTREEAQNSDLMEKQWKWFTSSLRTRLRPKAAIILIMTRWDRNDLGGMLLDMHKGDWDICMLRATSRGPEEDPLGRPAGEMLWDNDQTYAYAEEMRAVKIEFEKAGAMRDWQSLYEQDPHPSEGALFKVGMIKTIPVAPMGGQIVRGWDFAATAKTGTRNPDWTAGVKIARHHDGRYSILDIVRFRGTPDEVEKTLVNTAKADGKAVIQDIPQDPGQAGKVQVANYTKMMPGHKVHSSPESGSKEERASPFISQCNVGNVDVVKNEGAAWPKILLEEMRDFPGGKKDQIDACSRAFARLIATSGPLRVGSKALAKAGAVHGIIRPIGFRR